MIPKSLASLKSLVATAKTRPRHFQAAKPEELEARILLCACEETPLQPVDDYFIIEDYRLEGFGNVLANDANLCDGTVVIDDQPLYGSVELEPDGDFIYTPDGLYAGQVTFTYVLSTHLQTADPVTVTLELKNDPPQAENDGDYFSLDCGTLSVDAAEGLLVNDTKDLSESNVASLVSQPQHGIVSVSPDGSFTYTPEPLYPGYFWFEYRITDGPGATSNALAYLQVMKVTITKQSYAGSYIWIGESVSLRADNIEGVTNPTFTWSVSDDAIKNYVTDYYTTPTGVQQPRAYKVPLEAADKTSSSIGFYWVSSGSKTASVTVTANGQTSTAQVEYNVQKPEFTFWAQVGDIYKYGSPSGVSVALGKRTAVTRIDGITFHIGLPDPDIEGDEFDFLQVASISATRTLADGTPERLNADGVDPDHVYLYDYDIVAMKLNPNARSYNVNYEFETYLKWKGPRDGIYVPVSKIDWSFGWSTTSTNGTSWTDPVKSGTLDRRIDGVNGVYFPEYNRSVQYAAGGLTADDEWGGWERDD